MVELVFENCSVAFKPPHSNEVHQALQHQVFVHLFHLSQSWVMVAPARHSATLVMATVLSEVMTLTNSGTPSFLPVTLFTPWEKAQS